MQWPLSGLLLITSGFGYLLGGTLVFGFGTTVTSVLIIAGGGFGHKRLASPGRLSAALAIHATTFVALYFGTFVAFHAFRAFPISLVPNGQPNRVVVFSIRSNAHFLALQVYRPLIRTQRHRYIYPNLREHDALLAFGDDFTPFW